MRIFLFTLLITISFSCKKDIRTVDVPDEPPITDSTLNNAVIAFDGNSLTWGRDWGKPFPEQLQQTIPFKTNGAKFYNKGISGQQTTDMIARASVNIDALYDSTVRSILIAWEMSNDLAFNGDVIGAVERMEIYCKARKAKGWQVIILSILPRIQTTRLDDPESFQKKIDAANAILKVRWRQFADGLIDVTSDARLTAPSNTDYFVDGIHLNTAGMSVVRNLIIKELKSLK